MKKSILLSSFIMLLILFVTLTTTTFAWYQASGGNITISGSSTASVTTTGPDSPYLVISENNTFTKTVDAVPNTPVSQANYSNFLTITPAESSDLGVEVAYPVFTAGALTKFVSPVTGDINDDSVHVLKYTFHIKNIGDMPLEVDFNAYGASSTELSTLHFAYMISLTSVSTNYYYSSYEDNTHHGVSKIAANNTDITIAANTAYEVNFYLWINYETQFDNSYSVANNVNDIEDDLMIKFENVEIKTS